MLPVKNMPAPYTDEQKQELALAICKDVSSGSSVLKACRKKGRPNRDTFYVWLREHPEIQAMYRAALKARAHAFAEEMIDIADSVAKGATPEQIQAARLRIDTRKWNAARMEPTVYGERVRTELANADDKPFRMTTAQELTDDELAAIAAGRGDGTPSEA